MSKAPVGETKQRVLRLLLDRAGTAEELASTLGVNPSVSRRHLDALIGQGLVESSFKRAGRGRPKRIYSISSEGRAKIAPKYELVSMLLTDAARKSFGPEKTLILYKSAAKMLADAFGIFQNPESMLPTLEDFGFRPELRKAGRREMIISKNCPILKLAQENPRLTCDTFHTTFLRQALENSDVTLKQSIARGANECLHEC